MPSTLIADAEPIAGYSLVERIGAGGFGEVWKAVAPGGLAKAIKFVYGFLDDVRAAQEQKSLERIKEVRHPFLLSLERIEVREGQLVIVSELADGSLQERFVECREAGLPGIPRDELLLHLRDAADGLDYLAEHCSLAHLDVKPENLLLVGGRVKVADFGLVKDLSDQAASLIGGLTPVYSAPELFDNRPHRHSDQYSLAIVYQQMLCGESPFPGRTPAQLAAQHLHSSPRLDVLPPLDRPAVARALSKRPDDRFPSCRAMVDSLVSAVPRGTGSVGSAAVATVANSASGTCQATQPIPAASAGLRNAVSRTQPFAAPAGAIGGKSVTHDEISDEAAGQVMELPPLNLPADEAGLRPTLFVGIGGTAGHVLKQLRRRLVDRFGDLDQVPLRMLLLDTDGKSLAQATRGDEALDPRDTLALPLRRPQDYKQDSNRLLGWLSRRWLYNIPRSLQTEGLRPLGRLAYVDHEAEVAVRIKQAVAAISSPADPPLPVETTGFPLRDAAPRVFVIASICGGAGGGMVADVGAAVRTSLRQAGLPDANVYAVLTSSSSRRGHERDLALANTCACLTELQHFAGNQTQAFGEMYLVQLGEDLDERRFDQACDSLAEYLYLNATAACGPFFDACRRMAGDDEVSNAALSVRTVGLRHVGGRSSDELARNVDRLCASLLRHWSEDEAAGDRRAEVPREPAPAENANARLGPRELEALAAQQAEAMALAADPLKKKMRHALDKEMGGDSGKVFRHAWAKAQASAALDDPAAKSGAAGRHFQDHVNSLLGAPGGDASAGRLAAAAERRVHDYAAASGEEVRQWLDALIELPAARVRGARRAAGWLIEHLRGVKTALAETRQRKSSAAPDANAAQHVPAEHRSLKRRFEAFRGHAAPDEEAHWLQYFESRLDELALVCADRFLQSLHAQLSAHADRLTDWKRNLAGLLPGFNAGPAESAAPMEKGLRHALADVNLDPSQTESLPIERHLPRLAARLDQAVQQRCLDPRGGLRGVMLQSGALNELPPLLRHEARLVLQEFYKEHGAITAQFEAAEDPLHANQSLSQWLESALPAWLSCGAAKRTLVVLPPGAAGRRFREMIGDELASKITFAYDSDGGIVVCHEAERLSLSRLVAALVKDQPQCLDIARRLHTRTDVAWTPLRLGRAR